MGFQVHFYQVSKRLNSTFVPSESDIQRTVSCVVKDGTGVLNPIITIAMQSAEFNPSVHNYCYIPDFHRYYWVSDWVNEDNMWTAKLKVDVLASYKSTIESERYYILRSSTSFDTNVADYFYPKKPQVHRSEVRGEPLWQLESGMEVSGMYVVGIVNKQGTCNFYSMSPANFKTFSNAVFGNIKWMVGDGIEGITDNLVQIAVNPAQYITSVMWLPFTVYGTQMSGVSIGWWDITGITLYKLTDNLWKTFTTTVAPTSHPQISRGNYLNCSPFRNIRVYVPPFGTISVDAGKVRAGEAITISADVDFRTGSALCRVLATNEGGGRELLGVMYSNVGVSISVSDIKTNYSSVSGGIANTLSSLTRLDVAGFAKGIADTAMSVGSAEVATKGGQGSSIGLTSYIYCYIDCLQIADEDRADNGRPYCKLNTFKTLGSGYYIVENGRTPIPRAFHSEIEEVKNYLESGVYYA